MNWFTRAFLPGVSVLLGGLAVLFGACSSDASPTTQPGQPVATSAPGVAPTSPTAGERLVVYSGRSEVLIAPIIKQFTEATGVQVDVKYGATSALAATLLEEGSRSPADVYFAQDPGDLGAVKDLLGTLPDDIVNAVPAWARSPEARWVGLSGRARVVVYNTAQLTEADLPDSIAGFADPRWKGQIGWAPGNSSFQAMVSAMRVLLGEGQTLAWAKGVQANQPKAFPNNTSIVRAVAAGEVQVGFVNHYYLHQLIAEEGQDVQARNYFTRSRDGGSVVLVAGAGVLATSKNKGAAERFLRFMLSPVAQQYFAGQTHEYPLAGGVAHDPLLPDLESLQVPELDLSRLDDVKGTQSLLRQAGVIP